jgi:hypothetical protein
MDLPLRSQEPIGTNQDLGVIDNIAFLLAEPDTKKQVELGGQPAETLGTPASLALADHCTTELKFWCGLPQQTIHTDGCDLQLVHSTSRF